MSQAEETKPEPESQDATMDDAPSPAPAAAPPAEKAKASLEDLFDDDDSDGEFASSAPVKSEGEASQPAPLYAMVPSQVTTHTHTWQQDNQPVLLLRP